MVVNREMFTLLFTLTKKHLQILLRKCLIISVGVVGFEPTAPCSQSRCANRAALHPESILKRYTFYISFPQCGERGIRTPGTLSSTHV